MKMTTRFTRSRIARRGGFTLIELMIVITIIVALMALMASAVLKFIQVQQESNTQSTLDRTQSQLGRAWSKVKDAAYKEPIPPTVALWLQSSPSPATSLAGSDANATGRMRVLYVKLKMRQAFPMNFNEVFNIGVPAGYPLLPLPAYATYLAKLGIGGSTAATAPYESSACLLMALQRGVSGAGIDPSQLMSGGAAGSYPAPLGNLPYLNDAWGRPIFFTRAPAGSLALNTNPWPSGGQPGANDPGDPQGYLQTPGWASIPGSNPPTPTPQGALFVALTQQQLAGANSSYKLAPMVASAGPANWMKNWPNPVNPFTFHPITFAPGYFTWSTAAFVPSPGTGALFSTP